MIDFSKDTFPNKWEIVYFLTTKCNHFCDHCWSKNNFLGTEISLEQHEKFLSIFDCNKIKELKLSGGEVTLYKDLKNLITLVRKYLPNEIDLTMFSNGRIFFSPQGYVLDKNEIFEKLNDLFGKNKINLHISIDEYHIKHFAKMHNLDFKIACKEYEKMINILSCYNEINQLVDIKFKLHCNFGRLNWHRKNIYKNLKEESWENKIIKTEGLIKAGNAKNNIEESVEIEESKFWSAFLMPGAKFSDVKESAISDCYTKDGKEIYLNPCKDGNGAVVLGWWNMINKKFFGGDIYEFFTSIK